MIILLTWNVCAIFTNVSIKNLKNWGYVFGLYSLSQFIDLTQIHLWRWVSVNDIDKTENILGYIFGLRGVCLRPVQANFSRSTYPYPEPNPRRTSSRWILQMEVMYLSIYNKFRIIKTQLNKYKFFNGWDYFTNFPRHTWKMSDLLTCNICDYSLIQQQCHPESN